MSDYESDSSSESVDASFWIKLKDIKTIKQRYEEGVLKKPQVPAPAPAPASDASSATTGDQTAKEDASGSGDAAQRSSSAETSTASTTTYPPKASLLERISLFQGDITKLQVDSIVNAANKSLLGGGGVDGAIHHAAGPKLLAECKQLNGAATGESKITKGYNLPALHVIHTVGPVYNSSEVEEKARLLASCYQTSLQVAVDNQLKHIAFPSVSTGIYGYPIDDATHIALKTVRNFVDKSEGDKLERVIFVVWSNKDKEVYEELIPQYFPPVEISESS